MTDPTPSADRGYHDILLIAVEKEALLGRLVAWLKAKGLWEQAYEDCK